YKRATLHLASAVRHYLDAVYTLAEGCCQGGGGVFVVKYGNQHAAIPYDLERANSVQPAPKREQHQHKQSTDAKKSITEREKQQRP
ncbi:hypothetical protein ACOI9Y_37075, partial [Mesorhizobium japonicum]